MVRVTALPRRGWDNEIWRQSRHFDGGGFELSRLCLSRGLDAEMLEKTTKADEEGIEEVEYLGDNSAEEEEDHLLMNL
jgi:hypothetical protein